MTAALHNLIESSLRTTGTFPEASDCAKFEDWLDFRLSVLETIRRMDHRLQQRSRSAPVDRSAVEQVHHLFELWYTTSAGALEELERLEGRGCVVQNAAEFRAACQSSHVPGLEPNRLASAAEQFRAGRGRPLAEVMDGVRRRTVG